MKKFLLLLVISVFLPINVFAYSLNLIPGGESIGIKINTEGLVVSGFYKVNGEYIGKKTFVVGDKIIKINGIVVNNSDSKTAKFAVRCTKSLYEFCKGIGLNGFELADPTAMICAIHPEIMTKCIEAYATVETKKEENYGQVFLDQESKTPNSTTCIDLNSNLFKKYLFDTLLVK